MSIRQLTSGNKKSIDLNVRDITCTEIKPNQGENIIIDGVVLTQNDLNSLTKQYLSVIMDSLIDINTGFDDSYFMTTTNLTTENTWFQIGTNVTKNGVTCTGGLNTSFNALSSGDFTFNPNDCSITVGDGVFKISVDLTCKRDAGTGERLIIMGISYDGNQPTDIIMSSQTVAGQDFILLTGDVIIDAVAPTTISIWLNAIHLGGTTIQDMSISNLCFDVSSI